jgi:hypothetical protein
VFQTEANARHDKHKDFVPITKLIIMRQCDGRESAPIDSALFPGRLTANHAKVLNLQPMNLETCVAVVVQSAAGFPKAPNPFVAALLSPFAWTYGRPDLFDSYSCGILLMQMCVPQLRSTANIRQFNNQLRSFDQVTIFSAMRARLV